MKILISADIEGTCGICNWDETEKEHKDYAYFAQQMTKEVHAVCEAALESSKVKEVLVRDAHDSARNLIPDQLPEKIRLLRGWEGAPGEMISGISEGVGAVAMTGYHSAAYTDGNPLAHTSNTRNQFIKLNGKPASEFLLNTYLAAYYHVPVIFVSGDRALCDEVNKLNPSIVTVPVNEVYGGGVISIHPHEAIRKIKEGMKEALTRDVELCKIELPEHFKVEVEFKEYIKAKKGSYYPGAVRSGAKEVSFETSDFYEVVRFLFFVL